MTPVLLAAVSFHDALLIAFGLILGFAIINTIRWILGRRRRVHLPEQFLVEMTLFAHRFQRSAEQMQRLSKLLESPTRLAWKTRNDEILRTLRQMNRLLQRLNDFFEEKIQDYEDPALAGPSERATQPAGAVTDFSHPLEKDKFTRMKRITETEIASADWDALLDKLKDSAKDEDQSD